VGNIQLNPYLNFQGNTREAMEFYQQVLGGKLDIQTFGEVPGMDVPPGYEDKVMHAMLDADGVVIFASEGMPGAEVKFGDNISLCLNGSAGDTDRLTEIFNAVSDGGTVMMPLEKQFWGDVFGMATDKFGVQWMVDIASEATE
jgi:PhnB protein